MNHFTHEQGPKYTVKPEYNLEDESLLKLAQYISSGDDFHNRLERTTLHTVLLDTEAQNETLKETLHKMSRIREELTRTVQLLGVVSPSEEMLDAWTTIHQNHSVLALDSDPVNIKERLRDGGALILASETDLTPRQVARERIQQRQAAWEMLERKLTPEQRKLQNRSQTSGDIRAKQIYKDTEYDGFYDVDGYNGSQAQYKEER